MTLAFLGGSFDPVHLGHVALARDLLDTHAVDEVRFLIARRPPHKPERRLAEDGHRLEMLRRALANEPRLSIDDRELARTGPSYTVMSMEEVRREHPDEDLCFILGADNLPDLPQWHAFERLKELCRFIVVARPGEPGLDPEALARIGGVEARVRAHDVSSSEIRRDVARGVDVSDRVHPEVARYIEENGLYASRET